MAPGRVCQQRPSVQLHTQTTPKAQHTGQPCWDSKCGEVLCLCWECWASWERTWECTPLPRAIAESGPKPSFSRSRPARGTARQRCSECHVLESLCQGSGAWRGQGYSWLPAGVWPKRALGFGGFLVLAGSRFWRAVILARAISKPQGCG